MKNYKLIAELNNLPAGHEVVFDSIVNIDECITGIDSDMSQVTQEIKTVEFEENRIILCQQEGRK